MLVEHWEPAQATSKVNDQGNISVWAQQEGVRCGLTSQPLALHPKWRLGTHICRACCCYSPALISTQANEISTQTNEISAAPEISEHSPALMFLNHSTCLAPKCQWMDSFVQD